MAFLRRRRDAEQPADETAPDLDDSPDLDGAEPFEEDAPAEPAARPGSGPYDTDEVDDPADGRIDLGSLFVPSVEGMELRVEVDEASGQLVAVTLAVGDSALQVSPFAAPRSSGIWDQVRIELRGSVASQGGTADEVEGPFGTELRARIPVRAADGSSAAQRVRFLGVDGPRWFLRGVLSGAAAEHPESAGPMEDLFRQVVVVRGDSAMAPRELIPIRLPAQPGEGERQEAVDPLNPFRRGPEITEIR